jgi:hypothetical protein
MADAVKITVIATGFQPHSLAVVEEGRVAALAPQLVPEPIAVMAPDQAAAAEPEPEAPVFDPEDLDTPAYLRQGRLLN